MRKEEPGSFERRRTSPEQRAQREEELRELTRSIAERIRPVMSHLEEEELQALARDMARSEFRFYDRRERLDL